MFFLVITLHSPNVASSCATPKNFCCVITAILLISVRSFNNKMECCRVRKALSEECDKMSYTPRISMINFDDQLESDKELLVLRCTTRDQI